VFVAFYLGCVVERFPMCWLGCLEARARGAERGSLVARADIFGRQWGMRPEVAVWGVRKCEQ